MENSIEKTCPYCKQDLFPGDESVVCSTCGQEHHRACWDENGGCTTFACQSTEAQRESVTSQTTVSSQNTTPPQNTAAPQNSRVGFCPQCGEKQDLSSRFCGNCGARADVNPSQGARNNAGGGYQAQGGGQPFYPPPPYASPFNAELDPEVEQYIGENTNYYMGKFRELKMQNKKESWNWSAFLFPAYWFIYRKMYLYALCLFLAPNFLAFWGPFGRIASSVCISVVFGIFGNHIYMRHLEKIAMEGRHLQEPLKGSFVASKRGVNVVAVGILVTVSVIVLILSFSLGVFLSGYQDVYGL